MKQFQFGIPSKWIHYMKLDSNPLEVETKHTYSNSAQVGYNLALHKGIFSVHLSNCIQFWSWDDTNVKLQNK